MLELVVLEWLQSQQLFTSSPVVYGIGVEHKDEYR